VRIDRFSSSFTRLACTRMALTCHSSNSESHQDVRVPCAVQSKRFVKYEIARPYIQSRRMNAKQHPWQIVPRLGLRSPQRQELILSFTEDASLVLSELQP